MFKRNQVGSARASAVAPSTVISPVLMAARVRSVTPVLVGELENSLCAARLAWQKLVNNAADYDFSPDLARVNNHPLPEKQQQLLSGRLALGLDPLEGP